MMTTKTQPSIARKSQRGIVLVLSLIMLIAVTILVMAGVKYSGNQFLVINNVTEQKRAEAAAREAIEIVLNAQTVFSESIVGTAPAASANTCVATGCNINGYSVRVTLPYCYGARPAPNYSALSNVVPEDTHWEVVSVATDTSTGTIARVVEGVKIRLGAGNCGDAIS